MSQIPRNPHLSPAAVISLLFDGCISKENILLGTTLATLFVLIFILLNVFIQLNRKQILSQF